MLVVADSSPLNFLIRLGYADSLPKLFREVAIPPQVEAELTRPETPKVVRDFIMKPPAWLTVRTPSRIEPIPGIDPGEAAAINLARELKAALLLIDERDGRRAARQRNIPITGTIGVLERAAEQGLVNLSQAFLRLKEQPDFWIRPKDLDERLALFSRRQKNSKATQKPTSPAPEPSKSPRPKRERGRDQGPEIER